MALSLTNCLSNYFIGLFDHFTVHVDFEERLGKMKYHNCYPDCSHRKFCIVCSFNNRVTFILGAQIYCHSLKRRTFYYLAF